MLPKSTIPPPETQPATSDTQGDLVALLGLLWRGKWTLLAFVGLLPLVVYLYSTRLADTYEASTELQVQAQSVDTSLFTAEVVTPERSLAAAARLVDTTGVAAAAARKLDPSPRGLRALLRQITVVPDEESGFLTITARAGDAQRAADIANAFASAVVATRAQAARRQVDVAIDELRKAIGQVPPSDSNGRRQLSQQLQRLRALRAAQGNNAQIVERAEPPADPIAPKPLRNATLAAILALLLGAGLVVLRDRLNRRIRSGDELERLSGMPLLGTVPEAAFVDGTGQDTAEAFQFLRASLTYFNVDRELTSVLVTSPLKGDGKTTVVTNLAMAFARSGRDVILLDADMRSPQVASRMGIAAGKADLGRVLTGQAVLEDALVGVDVEPGRLRLLPAGPSPPNPSELIGSERMRNLLVELSEIADLIIVDTPPVLLVSDAIPLLDQVSGIVVVGRIGKTTRDAVSRVVSVISTARGTLLGVVATGGRAGGLYGQGQYGPYGGEGLENGGRSTAGNGEVSRRQRRFVGRSRT